MGIHFNSSNIISKPDKRYEQMSQLLLEGKLAVDVWFQSNPDYSIDNMDWNIRYTSAASTFQLFLQALRPVSYLCSAYLTNREEEYIILAERFISSWIDYEKLGQYDANEYVWDEHAAALRAENLLYYLLITKETGRKIEEKTVLEQLHKHILWLRKNYLENENHGLYEDRALIYCGLGLDDISIVKFACVRAKKQMDFLFSEEGVTVENSFSYHRVNLNLVDEIGNVLFSAKQNELARPFLNTVCNAEEFMGQAIKPNGVCASFGDTFEDDYIGYQRHYGDNALSVSCNGGYQNSGGTKRVDCVKSFPKSGYLCGREFWDRRQGDLEFKDSTWILFKCGYTSITHKQADENSFELYSRGEDIFVDSGAYNYNFRDPIRMHVRSATAHNTVIVDGKSFEFLRKDLCNRCGIMHSWVDDKAEAGYVVGFNHLYFGVVLYRHFIYYKNLICIIDEIYSKNSHKYSQLFQLGEKIVPVVISSERFVGKIADTNYCVSLVQDNCDDVNVELFNGSVAGHDYGLASRDFNESHYINTVVFSEIGNRCRFVSFIEIAPLKECTLDSRPNIQLRDDCLLMLDNTIHLIDTNNLNDIFHFSESYSVYCKDTLVTVKTDSPESKKYQFAWYIIDEKTKQKIYETKYSKDCNFIFDFEKIKDGKYSIRLFYKNLIQGKKSQIICHISKNGGNLKCNYELNVDETEA